MRVLGDGYYSLAYRDDLARWDVVGPRVLTAGLHVNGPNGYVSAALGAHLDRAARAEVAVELQSVDEIERRLEDHIARGVDVIKIATTHGDMGFEDAKPDLPEAWVREIVRVAHQHGLKVTAHSYGTEGDWAAVRGGVDGIEHLVNVPHELPDDLVQAIKARGIYVCPTLSGSAYSVWKFLRAPELLYARTPTSQPTCLSAYAKTCISPSACSRCQESRVFCYTSRSRCSSGNGGTSRAFGTPGSSIRLACR